MQEKQTTNSSEVTDRSQLNRSGRIVALDPGTKRVGVAVSDETQTIATPLPYIARSSWKNLLSSVQALLTDFDAIALVIGLPLESDGKESEMSVEARDMTRKFDLSLAIPVFLEDERVTSYEAKARLWNRGIDETDSRELVDSEAAAIILSDFLDRL